MQNDKRAAAARNGIASQAEIDTEASFLAVAVNLPRLSISDLNKIKNLCDSLVTLYQTYPLGLSITTAS